MTLDPEKLAEIKAQQVRQHNEVLAGIRSIADSIKALRDESSDNVKKKIVEIQDQLKDHAIMIGRLMESLNMTGHHNPNFKRELKKRMMSHFNDANLRELLFELGGDAEEVLTGKTLGLKIQNVIEYCDDRHELKELLKACQEARPKVRVWPEL